MFIVLQALRIISEQILLPSLLRARIRVRFVCFTLTI